MEARIYDFKNRKPIAANDERLQGGGEERPKTGGGGTGGDVAQESPGFAGKMLRWIGNTLLFLLFQGLNWFRFLLIPIKVASFLSLCALVIIWVGMAPSADTTRLLISVGVFGFLASVFSWCYEAMLTRMEMRFLYGE